MLSKWIRTVATVLLAILCLATYLHGQEVQEDSLAASQGREPDARTLFVRMFLTADKVWAELPDGTVLQQADFKGHLGDADSVALIGAGVDSISNIKGHVRIVFSKAGYERDIKGIHVKFKQVVECDVRTTAGGGMEITNLKGMSVSYPLMPGISVKSLTMDKDPCGDITVSAHITLVGFIHTSYSVSAGADGKPLNPQQPVGLGCGAGRAH